MGHALRLLLTREQPLDGTVEMDEFYIGGSPRNDADRPHLGRGRKGQPRTTKTPVLAVVQRPASVDEGAAAGDARAHVVADLSERETYRVLSETVDTGAHLMSDQWKAFVSIGEAFAAHDTVRIRAANMPAVRSMRTQRKVSMTAFAGPSRGFSITSVRSTPTSISPRSAFAGRNESDRDRRCAKPARGEGWSRLSGPAFRPRSSCQRHSNPRWDANCAALAAAGSRSAVPWLSLVDKGEQR
jgi:hypothetical protein